MTPAVAANDLVHPKTDYSGKAFGRPGPMLFTRAWRIKHGSVRLPLTDGITPVLAGQDSITATSCTKGLAVYAGYFNGSFANLNSFRSAFPAASYILAITPNGMKGARCIDCEPGDASVTAAAQFVSANLPTTPPAQGRNDQGKPMVYCSAGDSQAVINAVSALGISRSQWILFSAHWIGSHICAPGACGFPAADATQYMDGANFDSDMFYAYCFGTVFPLVPGSAGTAVATLQGNLNDWASILAKALGLKLPLLSVDGQFGQATSDAVAVAQSFFDNGGVSGTCDQALFSDLAATPVAPSPPVPPAPPVPPPWVFNPVASLTLGGAGAHSVAFKFTVGGQSHPGIAKFQVVVCKGDQLGDVIDGYPRYVDYVATGDYGEQYGSLDPATGYTMGVRAMAQDGSHSSPWAILHFQTAPAA